MKKTGAYVGIVFGGLILFWFLFINLPRVLEQLSSYNSSNANGIAAIAGTIVGTLLILIADIALIRSGMKKLKGNEDENINDKMKSEDVEDSENDPSNINNTEEEIIQENVEDNFDLKNDDEFRKHEDVNKNNIQENEVESEPATQIMKEKKIIHNTNKQQSSNILIYILLVLVCGIIIYLVLNRSNENNPTANKIVGDTIKGSILSDSNTDLKAEPSIDQLDEPTILKNLYGNWNSKSKAGKMIYFAKHIPNARSDGRNRPCEGYTDSLEYFIFFIQKMIYSDETYFVYFINSGDHWSGSCLNSWFDVAVYYQNHSKDKPDNINYTLVSFQPFLFETNRGDIDVKTIQLSNDELGFQFTRTFNQMGSSGYGAIYQFSPWGLNEALKYMLYDAHSCYGFDDWGKKNKYSVKTIMKNDSSEYYDIEINSMEEERVENDSCKLVCIHSHYAKSEDGYRLVSQSTEPLFSFKNK